MVSSVPQNKQELAHAIQQMLDKILIDYSCIIHAICRQSGIQGNVKGTKITVHDTLAL